MPGSTPVRWSVPNCAWSSPICRSTCPAGAPRSGCAAASNCTRFQPLPIARCTAPRGPRHGANQEHRPAGPAGDLVQFPGQRLRFSGADLRHESQPEDRSPTGAEAVCRRGGAARARGSERSGDDRGDPRARRLQPALSAPAAWGARSTRWSTHGCASMASIGCASPTPRSWRTSRAADQSARIWTTT